MKHSVQKIAPIRIFRKFLDGIPQDAFAGMLLSAVAAAAIFLTNSKYSTEWNRLLDTPIGQHPICDLASLREMIGNGLMVIFFFTVGLEVKREMLIGNLADPLTRRLPVLAAVAGMVGPSLIYLAVTGATAGLVRGWAIPTATDIAFAMGVVGLLGRRVPPALRLFLLTVAVVDDIGAVIVIALAYTAQVDALGLAAAVGVLAAMVALNRLGYRGIWPFVGLAVGLWWCVLHSGVHATVAGVLAALTVPLAVDGRRNSPLLRLEHALTPWSGYVIVPLFGLAQAGVALGGGAPAVSWALPLAIATGLVVGKPLGIFGAIWTAERLGFAARPVGVSWLQALGAGQLAGIGFTMSMFIGTLAFAPDADRQNAIRMGILAGSLVAGMIGAVLLWIGAARADVAPDR